MLIIVTTYIYRINLYTNYDKFIQIYPCLKNKNLNFIGFNVKQIVYDNTKEKKLSYLQNINCACNVIFDLKKNSPCNSSYYIDI